MILLRNKEKATKNIKIKMELKVLPENTGYLGRYQDDLRRNKVISGMETAGSVLNI